MPAERFAGNAGTCPLCRRPNACALAAGSAGTCWCERATFDPALRERATRLGGAACCICAACAGAAGATVEPDQETS